MTTSPDTGQAVMGTPGSALDLTQLDDARLSQYRHPSERWALLAIGIGAVILLSVLWAARPYLGSTLAFLPGPIVKLVISWTHPQRLGLIVLVTLMAAWVADVIGQAARAWQLAARAVEITPTTFPNLAPIVDELRARFDVPRARVYVSREAPLAGYTVGVRPPHAIVLSAAAVGMLTPEEFRFVLGREFGHIKLGHTWAATVLGSTQMHLPDPLSYLLKVRQYLFGSYQHAQELSCDRIGVVATRDVRPALSALIKQDLGAVKGGNVDIASLAPQAEALRRGLSGASLTMMQRLSAQPFAVARLIELTAWAGLPPEAPAAKPAETADSDTKPAPATAPSAAPDVVTNDATKPAPETAPAPVLVVGETTERTTPASSPGSVAA